MGCHFVYLKYSVFTAARYAVPRVVGFKLLLQWRLPLSAVMEFVPIVPLRNSPSFTLTVDDSKR
jgi:hypothetical protein